MGAITWIRDLLGRPKLNEDEVQRLQEDYTNIAVDWLIKQYVGYEVETVPYLPPSRVFRVTTDLGQERSVYLKGVKVSPEKHPDVWNKQSANSKEALRRVGVYAGTCGKRLYIYRKLT